MNLFFGVFQQKILLMVIEMLDSQIGCYNGVKKMRFDFMGAKFNLLFKVLYKWFAIKVLHKRALIFMNFNNSKYKSTAHTLDTYNPNSATYNLSLFDKDIKQIHDQPNQHFSYLPDGQIVQDDEPNPFSSRLKPDIRQRYIYRMLGSQQNQELPSIKHQHVFIFDWDDTLLFTSYLKEKKITEIIQEKKELSDLNDIVCKILDFSLKKGSIFIITNALNGWINYSSKTYLPEVHKKITSNQKIMMISARQYFEKRFPDDTKMWKIQAFKNLKHYLPTNILTNFVCIGDQQNDLQACQVLRNQFKISYIKKIKLEQRPRPAELIKQLKVLEKKLQQIFHAIANTTIKLEKRILTPQNLRKSSQDILSQRNLQKIQVK